MRRRSPQLSVFSTNLQRQSSATGWTYPPCGAHSPNYYDTRTTANVQARIVFNCHIQYACQHRALEMRLMATIKRPRPQLTKPCCHSMSGGRMTIPGQQRDVHNMTDIVASWISIFRTAILAYIKVHVSCEHSTHDIHLGHLTDNRLG